MQTEDIGNDKLMDAVRKQEMEENKERNENKDKRRENTESTGRKVGRRPSRVRGKGPLERGSLQVENTMERAVEVGKLKEQQMGKKEGKEKEGLGKEKVVRRRGDVFRADFTLKVFGGWKCQADGDDVVVGMQELCGRVMGCRTKGEREHEVTMKTWRGKRDCWRG
ncbi:hypothetical protein KUCAC02_009611 [Chaenocephalus aceratus]|nr:hypothetical protein KUCAC02_009611 [Chaenocephalus aceratus]